MNPINKILTSTLLVSSLALSVSAYGGNGGKCDAQNSQNDMPPMHKMDKRNQSPIKMIFKELNLSDAQKSELKALMKAQRQERMEKGRGERAQLLANAISQDGFDTKAFETESKQHMEVKLTQRAQHLNKVINILTPNQRIAFKELLEKKASDLNSPKRLGY